MKNKQKKRSNIPILARSVRGNVANSLLAPLFVSMEVVVEVWIPTLMRDLIDKGVEPGDIAFIKSKALQMVAACLLSLFCGVASGYCASKASTGFARNLRRDMFYNIQAFSFSNIDKFSTSSLVTRLTTDVSNVQNAYMMIIRITVRSPFMFLFSLFMSFRINARLSMIFVCVVPFLAAGLAFIIYKAHPVFRRVFKTYDKLNRVVEEDLRGIRVVKSFVREPYEIKKFGEVSGSIYSDFSRAEKTIAFNGPLMQTATYTALLLISWFASKMIVESGATAMTTGALTTLISYTTRILMSLMMLSMIFVQLTLARASTERIAEVLSEKTDLAEPADPVYDVPDGSIEFDHVDFSYYADAEKLCLDDVSLKIESGQTVGVIGGTGSAKSTLVQMIPRLYDVNSGCVKVGGRDVREYDLKTLRDAVSMVLQKNVLFSGTIRENLRWGDADATDEMIEAACRAAQADGFIKSFPDGYDTFIEQGGSNVSGGQKQRLCIARALLKSPKIIIFDDSTSAVDTHTDALIRKELSRSIPDTTKIIIAQRIDSVKDADMIIVLDDGRIAETGTHDELLALGGIYAEVYSSQIKGDRDDG